MISRNSWSMLAYTLESHKKKLNLF